MCGDALAQAVVAFGPGGGRNGLSAGGMNGCNEFDGRPLHHLDFSKVRLQAWERSRDNTKVVATARIFEHQMETMPANGYDQSIIEPGQCI